MKWFVSTGEMCFGALCLFFSQEVDIICHTSELYRKSVTALLNTPHSFMGQYGAQLVHIHFTADCL